MKVICKTILFALGKICLLFSPKPTNQEQSEYLKFKSIIKKLYQRDLHWHGTGRYHYNLDYDGPQETTDIVDTLKGILKDKGLLPLVRDPWMKSNNEYKVTISLAKIRMYAAVYAFMSQKEKERIYTYGSRFFWLFMIDMTNFFEEPIDVIKHFFIFTFRIGNKTLRKYQSKFRSHSKLVDFKTFFLQLFYMSTMRSDIPGNYPIIIAIKRKNLRCLNINTGFDYFESRVDKPVKLEDISHFEVPSNNIDETLELLKKYSIKIPVISIESAEVYNRENLSVLDILTPVK